MTRENEARHRADDAAPFRARSHTFTKVGPRRPASGDVSAEPPAPAPPPSRVEALREPPATSVPPRFPLPSSPAASPMPPARARPEPTPRRAGRGLLLAAVLLLSLTGAVALWIASPQGIFGARDRVMTAGEIARATPRPSLPGSSEPLADRPPPSAATSRPSAAERAGDDQSVMQVRRDALAREVEMLGKEAADLRRQIEAGRAELVQLTARIAEQRAALQRPVPPQPVTSSGEAPGGRSSTPDPRETILPFPARRPDVRP